MQYTVDYEDIRDNINKMLMVDSLLRLVLKTAEEETPSIYNSFVRREEEGPSSTGLSDSPYFEDTKKGRLILYS